MANHQGGYDNNYAFHPESTRGGRPGDVGRGGGRGYDPPPPPPVASYQDHYPFFLPGEGIARQVIQTDLPRYLGNNAQCKPGQSREGRQGFWYKGYRMLTDAQILSLKEDSAKWNNERQQYASRHGGRDGPEYENSHTFGHSYRNNPDGLYPDGIPSFGSSHPSQPPPEVALEQQQPKNQDPRYLFMPHPDNRPWYDNWTGKYVPPFREPGAASPEPVPPRLAQVPRHVEPESNIVPGPEEGGPPNPLDPNTNLPMPGHWIRQRNGEWLFSTATRQPRAPTLYARDDPEGRSLGELD